MRTGIGDPEVVKQHPYMLRLYVSGNTVISARAIINLRQFCETYLAGSYDLEVVDVAIDRAIAAREDLLALPTLVKLGPGQVKRLIGDMSDTKRLCSGLGLVHSMGIL